MTDSTTRVPTALPQAQRALLDAYRAERGMPPRVKARLVERLEAPERSDARISRGWVLAGIGIAAAVALTWGASALHSSRASVAGSQTSDQAVMHGVDGPTEHPTVRPSPGSASEPADRRDPRSPAGSAADAAVPLEPPPQPHPAATPTPGASPADARANVKSLRRRRGDPSTEPSGATARGTAAEPATGPSRLSQERAILGRAWAALAVGDHGTALLAAEEHAERFPSGTLVVERRAMAAVASCKANRPGGSALAEAFLETHGKTPLARRVREACARPGETE